MAKLRADINREIAARNVKYPVGTKFNRLTIIERLPKGKARVKCDCGNVKEVSVGNMASGKTQSFHRTCLVRGLTASQIALRAWPYSGRQW